MFLIDFSGEFIFQKLKKKKTMHDAALNLAERSEILWEKVTMSTVKHKI